MQGEQYIEKDLRNELLNSFSTEEQVSFQLSIREKDVLKLICSGFPPKEIAEKLFISIHTVQSHLKNIMRKFKVNRTPDIIVFAIKNGLI